MLRPSAPELMVYLHRAPIDMRDVTARRHQAVEPPSEAEK